jgi:hypothetical protein
MADGGARQAARRRLIGCGRSPDTVRGDYISTSVLAGGRAWPTIAVAAAPTSGGLFDEAMHVPTAGLAVTGGSARSSAAGVVAAGPTQAASQAPAVTRH